MDAYNWILSGGQSGLVRVNCARGLSCSVMLKQLRWSSSPVQRHVPVSGARWLRNSCPSQHCRYSTSALVSSLSALSSNGLRCHNWLRDCHFLEDLWHTLFILNLNLKKENYFDTSLCMFLVLYFCEICFISAVQKGKPVELLCTVVKSVMVLVKYLYIDTLSFPKYVWRMKSSALIYVSLCGVFQFSAI